MNQIKKTGNVTYAWLGVSGQTLSPDVAKALGLGQPGCAGRRRR